MNKNIFNIGDAVTVLKEKRIGEIVGLRRWTITTRDSYLYEWIYWVAFDNNTVEKHEECDINKRTLSAVLNEIEDNMEMLPCLDDWCEINKDALEEIGRTFKIIRSK